MRTKQDLFNYVVTHLRTQGLESNRGSPREETPDGGACMCAFGCIADLYVPRNTRLVPDYIMGNIHFATEQYNHPKFISRFLGYEVTKESEEYVMIKDMESIFENWRFHMYKVFPCYTLGSELSLVPKEIAFRIIAEKFGINYLEPNQLPNFDNIKLKLKARQPKHNSRIYVKQPKRSVAL